MQPAAEGKVVRGFEDLHVGDRVRVELIHTDVEHGFVNFARVPLARFRREKIGDTVVFFGSARIAPDGPLGRFRQSGDVLSSLGSPVLAMVRWLPSRRSREQRLCRG
jgi:hypothetical protein